MKKITSEGGVNESVDDFSSHHYATVNVICRNACIPPFS